jgi:hypothetical protein
MAQVKQKHRLKPEGREKRDSENKVHHNLQHHQPQDASKNVTALLVYRKLHLCLPYGSQHLTFG